MDPVVAMKKVTAFLSIDDLDDSIFKKSFQIHKVNAEIKDMNQESMARLNITQIEIFNQIAGKVMGRLDYPLLKSGSR